jgi:hypothetical protein
MLILLIIPILVILMITYYDKKFNLNQKQNIIPAERVVTHGNNTMIKCTINNQTFSNNYNFYYQNRQYRRQKYIMFGVKLFFKVITIFLISATYYLNFVSICEYYSLHIII